MPRAREDWTGIHKHGVGWRAVVSLGADGVRRQFFPKSTPVAKMQKWRELTRAQWLASGPKRSSDNTSFRADADRYLKHPDIKKKPTYREFESDLKRWLEEFGDTPRGEITAARIRRIRDRWATEPRSLEDARPLSPARINRLTGRLSHVWTQLDGKRSHNPVRDVEPLTEDIGPVRDVPHADIEAMLAALSTRAKPVSGQPEREGSKTRARVMVLAATGLPASTLMRLTPADVDLKKRMIYRPGRHKGQGTDRSAQPLTKQAVDAFKEFIRLDCWGKFSNPSVRKSVMTAIKNAGVKPFRVYDLRHTFLSNLAKASKDEVAVMEIAQHAQINTTRRYTRGSVSGRAVAAVAAYEALMTAKMKKKPGTRVTTH